MHVRTEAEIFLFVHSEEALKCLHIHSTDSQHVVDLNVVVALVLFFFNPAVMDARPGLCCTAVYWFQEVISTSQESKSMGSRVIKSPCGFLGFISLLCRCASSLFVYFLSSIFPFLCYIYFCHICFCVLPSDHHLSSLRPSHSSMTSAPSHSQSPFLRFVTLSVEKQNGGCGNNGFLRLYS